VLREVWFEYDQAYIQSSEMKKVSEVATYLERNPSVRVGIDTFNDPNATDAFSRDLLQRRVAAVRDALINAGLPAYKIQTGGIDHVRYACNRMSDQNANVCRRVGMLIRDNN